MYLRRGSVPHKCPLPNPMYAHCALLDDVWACDDCGRVYELWDYNDFRGEWTVSHKLTRKYKRKGTI